MIRESEGIAGHVLLNRGFTLTMVREHVMTCKEKPNFAAVETKAHLVIINELQKFLEKLRVEILVGLVAKAVEESKPSSDAEKERARWLNAVVREVPGRNDPKERWCNNLTGDYQSSFHPTREEAEAAALAYVEMRNR